MSHGPVILKQIWLTIRCQHRQAYGVDSCVLVCSYNHMVLKRCCHDLEMNLGTPSGQGRRALTRHLLEREVHWQFLAHIKSQEITGSQCEKIMNQKRGSWCWNLVGLIFGRWLGTVVFRESCVGNPFDLGDESCAVEVEQHSNSW